MGTPERTTASSLRTSGEHAMSPRLVTEAEERVLSPGMETAEARLALNKQMTSFVNKVLQSITPTTDQRGVLRNIAETLATEAARKPEGRVSKQEQAIEEQLAQAASSALNLLPAQDMADVCITLTTQHQSTVSDQGVLLPQRRLNLSSLCCTARPRPPSSPGALAHSPAGHSRAHLAPPRRLARPLCQYRCEHQCS